MSTGPHIESLYDLKAAARRLGIATDRVQRIARRLGLPRRYDRGPHPRRIRVFTTSDLEQISAALVASLRTYTDGTHRRRR